VTVFRWSRFKHSVGRWIPIISRTRFASSKRTVNAVDSAYALNVFADQFSKSVQPLVPSRLFISNAGGTTGEGQGGGSVLETLLNLILSEKAGINLQENTGSSKPMEDFIRQFTRSSSAGNGDPLKRETPDAAEKVASR